MSWQAVTLTYRARSPLLLGRYPLGFIQRTRTFIPGWTLWGALTATLTRACFPQADGARYEAVGAWVEHNLLTSYAYLLVEGGLAAPHFRDGGWYYGPLQATQFEARFVTSLGQTAVAPGSLTAETNTLHETETLSPYDLATGEPARWRFTLYQRGSEEVSQSEDEMLAALTPAALLAALRTLVVGAGLLVHLRIDELTTILCHEMAHARAGDTRLCRLATRFNYAMIAAIYEHYEEEEQSEQNTWLNALVRLFRL